MKSLAATLLLVYAATAGAGQPGDGIYRGGRGQPLPRLISQDGQPLFVGAKQVLKVLKSELVSQANANDMFQLTLTIPYDESLTPGSYVLIVAGTAYRQVGSGSSQKESSSLPFSIARDENAKQVSRFLKTPIVYRRHPGHALRTERTRGERCGKTTSRQIVF